MTPAHLLVLAAVCVSFLAASAIPPQPLSHCQFKKMIKCTVSKSLSWRSFVDYGCYCGKGGSGTPVDELDRCCQTHDNCYTAAGKHPDCNHFWERPFTKRYSYTCSEGTLTCTDKKDKCAAFVCNCDRVAAPCLARAPAVPTFSHSRCLTNTQP
uniref:phospholipase A2 n=1 Tax=Calliophis bivirgatus TaxID=8633 RepID=A0A898IPP9_CALBG|nr:phospholipase A2 IB [Calliophis bivirgatus]